MERMSAESNAYSHLQQFRWWQGNDEMTEAETELRDAAALFNEAQDLLAQRARDAHDQGMSWKEIAEVLGITRQSASARFTNPVFKGYLST